MENNGSSLSRHILPVSATMVGVCVTLVGLVRVVEVHAGPTHVDEYAALLALLFLVSTLASYISMRYSATAAISRRCERLADQVFVAGLIAIAVIALLFAYEVI